MELRDGAAVYTAGGDKVGGVDRVVIDPLTKEVTHIVVRKGAILPKDKVVPADLIQTADEDRVVLRATGGRLDDLPDFEEDWFVPATGSEYPGGRYRQGQPLPLYWYPPVAGAPPGPVYSRPMGEGFAGQTQTVRNIPDDTVALKEGAHVRSADDKDVGNIERVYTEANDHVTHFVVSSGLIQKKRKLVPISWVNRIEEDHVRLNVGSEMIEALAEYRA